MLWATVEDRRKFLDDCLPLLPDAENMVDLFPNGFLSMRQRMFDFLHDRVDRRVLLMQQRKPVAAGSPNELLDLDLLIAALNGKKYLDKRTAVAADLLYVEPVASRSKNLDGDLVRVGVDEVPGGARQWQYDLQWLVSRLIGD